MGDRILNALDYLSAGGPIVRACTGMFRVRSIGQNTSALSSDCLRDFYPDRFHQFLEADQVEDPLEIVNQRHQAPFGPNLGQAFKQEMSVTEKAFDGAEGMFAQLLAQSDDPGVGFEALSHRFHEGFVLFAGNGATALVASALFAERAAFAGISAVIAYLPALFVGAEAIGQ